MSYPLKNYAPRLTDTDSANRQQMLSRLETALDALRDAYSNWATMSTAQRDAATRQMIRVVAALLQLTLNSYGQAPV